MCFRQAWHIFSALPNKGCFRPEHIPGDDAPADIDIDDDGDMSEIGSVCDIIADVDVARDLADEGRQEAPAPAAKAAAKAAAAPEAAAPEAAAPVVAVEGVEAAALVAVEADDAPGRGGGPRMDHDRAQVHHKETGRHLGHIIMNEHPAAMSLDAHCRRCGVAIGRKYRARPGARQHHQGRPLASLLAWLHEPCGANHRTKYREDVLTFALRDQFRTWAIAVPEFEPLRRKERDPWPGGEGLEPLRLA